LAWAIPDWCCHRGWHNPNREAEWRIDANNSEWKLVEVVQGQLTSFYHNLDKGMNVDVLSAVEIGNPMK